MTHSAANQLIYVWFLIVFPILLIVLFFLTLNFNHKVLYAPSDFQNEDHFLLSLPRATFAEKFLKIEAKIAEEETATQGLPEPEKATSKATSGALPAIEDSPIPYQNLVLSSPQASYMRAEELIFRKLSKEFSAEIQREVKLDSPGGHYIYDGIVRDRGITTVIEVKLLRSAMMTTLQFRDTLTRIQESAKLLPSEQTANFRVLLALASDEGKTNQERVERVAAQIDRYRTEFAFPIEVRFYNIAELEREFNVGA